MLIRISVLLWSVFALGGCSATRKSADSVKSPYAFRTGKCYPQSPDTVITGSLVPVLAQSQLPEPIRAKPPAYPLSMLTGGFSGYVIATFVIDSSGRPPLGQIAIDQSTHPQFSQAVCAALPDFRWKPYSSTHQTAVIAKAIRFEFATPPR